MLDTLYNADVQCGSINRETIKRYLGYLVEEGFVAGPQKSPNPSIQLIKH